ncbi:FtsX-like permease family protein [Ekhidna sp.]|uniref:FtsX-like permease family protein n=1 Tax=Ekhidna sp. TaxID=2608089 RepID=UPI0032989D1E
MTKKGQHRPPEFALKFFRWYCKSDKQEELEGDLEEFFSLRIHNGSSLWKARLFFWWNVLRCYRSYAKRKTQKTNTMYPLFKSYFKLAMRHSWKNKWSVMINVVGLGLALSMCIFVYSIYAYNFEFDSYLDNTDDIYRAHSITYENGSERQNEITPLALDDVLRNEISQVQGVSSFFDEYYTVKKGADYFQQDVGVVSSDFFKMFEIPLWYGSYADFGDKPLVYLTKPTAKKFFGEEVALGKKLTVYVSSKRKIEVTVGGVFERIPLNTSFTTSMMISMDDFTRAFDTNKNDWANRFYVTHFVKATTASIPTIIDKTSAYLPQQNEGHKELKMKGFKFIPFRSAIHNDGDMYRTNTNARLEYTIHIIFTSLAAMVFLIACFNLANSSIAMIANRLKEIGIRKTLGSENRQIMVQFLMEMGIVCALAFIIGLSMINLTSSSIMGLFGESFLIKDIDLTGVILFVFLFLIFTTLVAGIMPALYAWKFQPVDIMRKSAKLRGVGWINKTLTIAQYSFSIAVLSAAVTFSKNSKFLDTLDLGYANESIYTLEFSDQEKYAAVKQKVDQIPDVKTVGAVSHIQRFGSSSQRKLLQIDTASYELMTYTVGSGYLELMEVPITLGRSFITGSELDQQNAIIVNQEFVKQYFENKNPLNQVIKIGDQRKTIVGVSANLIQDVYQNAEDTPAAYLFSEATEYRFLIAKVGSGDKTEIESKFKAIWSEEIDGPFGGSWQKNLAYGSAVRDTENLRVIFLAMAILGGFLSVAGIFSLSKLNVAKQIKEISIRKVLGSTLKQLLLKINKPFFYMLSIAVIVGGALGYLISEMVLSMVYKYYVAISPTTSLLSGMFITLVAVLIITLSVMTPAMANPVVGLRDD